ncbi:MAG: GTPase HflX [Thermoleophilia bacterium]|nr:GTPase HflX [Thermoleophilia bacterium]
MTESQHSTERSREKAVIVGMIAQGVDPEAALAEIRELLDTAGVDAIGELVQRREDPHPVTFIGSGKLKELLQLVEHLDPDIVVIDEELTPRQQRALEDKLERRVVDRTAVILDIFALHAHTAEGKVQVELAQLDYNLARMRGMWKHLEKLAGGIGTRGPGESQLETDRRLARDRIAFLRRKIKELSVRRDTQRSKRQDSVIPKIALAGYTNAGKSTLLNALTGSTVSMANRLFETLDPTTRGFERGGRRYLITDTVGFIERLPHGLVDAFSSTLEETLLADCVVLVADGSLANDKMQAQISAVRDVLLEIGAGDLPTLLCLNKIDQVDEATREQLMRQHPGAVLVSAIDKLNLDGLMDAIAASFADRWERVELLVPYADAGVISELYDAGAPVVREDAEDGIHASAHLPKRMIGRVAKWRLTPEEVAERAKPEPEPVETTP